MNNEKRKRRFGDRNDGRLLRSLNPMLKLMPYIMPQRNDALNFFRGTADLEAADNAGIPCSSVAWGFKGRKFLEEQQAEMIIETPAEIFHYL